MVSFIKIAAMTLEMWRVEVDLECLTYMFLNKQADE